MEKNQIIDLEITDLSYEAMGVAHYNGMTVFVTNALLGEVVSAKILKVKKNFAFAKIEKIKKESPDRVKVKLNQGVQSGLASLAHIKYDKQLDFKRNQVVNLLKKAHLENIEVGETLASPAEVGYRNKAQVPVREVNGQLEIGFFRRHSHDLMPLTHFFTTDPEIDRVLVAVRDILRKYKVPAYDEINNNGKVRYLEVRRSKSTGEMMVILVCLHKDFMQLPNVAAEVSQIPGVSGLILNHNPKKTNVILGPKDYLVFGNDQITDQIGDLKFRISPQSFFQINSLQTPRLYNLAIKQADLKPDDVVIDAYSGIGTIGLSVAKHVKAVRGIEVVRDAIKDAKDNAKLNDITNAKYYLGKAEEIMPRWAKSGLKTDVVFVDPPRKGLTPEFINAAVKTGPKKIVYISCNPATLVRDLQLFQEKSYEFNRIDPVDMFPQTPHVESVTVLERTEK
ncbi:MAG: 23S rRNA (uracil(1939)-C(5))-methyltransferase RlmD [Lactobacillus sp.]|uniref:23S rRNA (uracil(1939)-C(5))-methyltransferase RlmD n=1 Tax=Lactobacillus sp. TaxID=1591 RepID=UPI0026479152|nr:23S rRNA (uracil(1939)-C(5))-methyltransferase RlmD [Lactobacillus sp.]MDN6119643.1 23S rRNA (uracil(1939)-C(5))-methyltransferase RlmD [Lactococcus sp.]MDN5955250.1 23S rRNA (uracil(1939)-C(5))-methyltransferase RlmD [Lactobacillus sp.]MDN5989309.1 23S rRNA (uracil(1939)-C(5))-methyltransferase RlmD [Lactobacillus sp.]MDN6008022.1 23S rRNA (uracil(1939)-C(5))-methyltransferase RlmD [Lactobacillus sp.]MDN6590499.1 23S rRNA (uracil(1939)-C(5))-methyltransferase RlmD [Lactobacillus sp.]